MSVTGPFFRSKTDVTLISGDFGFLTQPGSRVCIATIQTMMVYSLSLAPLASFNRWRGWTTTGPFHQRMRCLIDLFAGKAYIPQPVGW